MFVFDEISFSYFIKKEFQIDITTFGVWKLMIDLYIVRALTRRSQDEVDKLLESRCEFDTKRTIFCTNPVQPFYNFILGYDKILLLMHT